ncbi:hypothetical protein BKA82DRAFT_627713 [Pisolithus tinctorius]|nr:hypothetical protein BKA82DRAFT_627713 [Pisolithus tinctorius]
MADRWKIRLTPEQRAGTPPIICLFTVTISIGTCALISFDIYLTNLLRGASVGYDTCTFLVLTRFAYVSSHEEIQEKLCESESNRVAKRRFVEMFGRGIQDSHMKSAAERYRTVDDLRRARR